MILFVLLFLYILYKWLNLKPKDFPPGPPTLPLVGSLPFITTRNFHLFLETIRETYGPVIGLKMGSLSIVAICGPREVMEILKREEFSSRPVLDRGLHPGVMFANGEHWKYQRRFAIRNLRDFGLGKSSIADMVHDEIDEFCAEKLNGKSIIRIDGLFSTSAINILWAMMAGSRLSYQDKDFEKLILNLTQLFRGSKISDILQTFPLLKNFVSVFGEIPRDRVNRLLAEFFQVDFNLFFLKKTIKEHRVTKSSVPRDFIDVYLNELDNSAKKPSFTEVTLIEICRDIFSAGAESSSNTISFAVMYLLLFPEWQEKLVDEIDRELNGRMPTSEDRASLPNVEAFLTEVQRCNTIAPLAVPHSVTKDTYFNGFCIPKGALIQVSIWSLLQDKQHWGDPEVFRPERFLDSNGMFLKDPYLLFFGLGPRVCLGEPLARNFVFLFFVSLLQRYKFQQPRDEPLPSTVCAAGFTTAPQPFSAQLHDRTINHCQKD